MLKPYEFNLKVVTQKVGARWLASEGWRLRMSQTAWFCCAYSAFNSSTTVPVASTSRIPSGSKPVTRVEQLRHGS